MRPPLHSRRCRWLACVIPLLLAGCEDDSVGPPNEQAIVFLHASWPDTIAASKSWTLRTFAFLGSDLCWELEDAGIESLGTTLSARGTSRHAAPPGGACPLALARDWVTIAGPALAAGDYVLEAGDLRDTVIVREGADPLGTRLMAHGRLWSYNDTWRFTSESYDEYLVSNPWVVPHAGTVRLYGSVQGREGDSVLVRRMEYESPVPVPEPTDVPIADVPLESERIYYADWCGREDEVREARDLLGQLLAAGLAVTRAWFPVGCSPCECATCTAGIVLELQAPDARIGLYGFVEDTGIWVFNCGIERMWRFDIAS